MRKIIYPTVKEVIDANKELLRFHQETKAEKHEIKKPKSVISNIIRRARRSKRDIRYKAWILYKGINQAHIFSSANKRTAHIVLNNFLWKNKDYSLAIKKNKQRKFAVRVREDKVSDKEFEKWLGK